MVRMECCLPSGKYKEPSKAVKLNLRTTSETSLFYAVYDRLLALHQTLLQQYKLYFKEPIQTMKRDLEVNKVHWNLLVYLSQVTKNQL